MGNVSFTALSFLCVVELAEATNSAKEKNEGERKVSEEQSRKCILHA